jgi:hypothetical protein
MIIRYPPGVKSGSPGGSIPKVLIDGERFAGAWCVVWAVLMKRTFGFDVLICPRCGL